MRNYLKILDKYPLNYRLAAIYTIALMPFYYLSLQLFLPEALKSRFEVVLCLCYCLSLTWYVFWLALMYVTYIMVYGKEDESKIPQFVSHNVVTLIVLPISIALSYFIGLSFIGFMVASYMLFILRIVIDFFVNPFLKRRQSKNRGNNKLVNKNNTTKR
jgi:hypothetical protein